MLADPGLDVRREHRSGRKKFVALCSTQRRRCSLRTVSDKWERHIEGALQVPRGLLEFVVDPASPRYNPELEPNRRVIIYCASGARAALATLTLTLTLKNMGYQNVANTDGGLKAWVAEGLPTAEHHADI
jgi:rhodanese-related sulfurtransferase